MIDGLLALVMFALEVCNYFLLYLLISYSLFQVKYKTMCQMKTNDGVSSLFSHR